MGWSVLFLCSDWNGGGGGEGERGRGERRAHLLSRILSASILCGPSLAIWFYAQEQTNFLLDLRESCVL